MKISENHTNSIYAPRSLGIFLIQYMSIPVIMTELIILGITLLSGVSLSNRDILFLFGLTIPLFLLLFIMLYFPNQYRTRVTFDDDKKHLHKTKKRTTTETHDLSKVKSIISKTIITNPGCKYNLIFEETENNARIIFNEDTLFGTGQWDIFSEKLSKIIGLPLRKELWVEDFNGNLSLVPHEESVSNKKRGWIIILIPLIISLIFALVYKSSATDNFKSFIFHGFISVLANMTISTIYFFFIKQNRDSFLESAKGSYFVAIFCMLTLIIPFSIFYILSALLIYVGIPFNY